MAADQPPQNTYGDPEFFAGSSRLERFGSGWRKAFEYPRFMALLPDVSGPRVLDLGCGAGQLAHHLAERGAAEVIGVDISKRMLGLARAERSHPRLTYRHEAIEETTFGPDRFDLAVSSLAIHYVADYRGLVQRIAGWLSLGGILVYSTEHQVYLTRASTESWIRDAAGRPLHWTVDAAPLSWFPRRSGSPVGDPLNPFVGAARGLLPRRLPARHRGQAGQAPPTRALQGR